MMSASERYASRLLYPVHVLAILPRAHRLGRRSAIEISDLAGEPLLLLRHEFGSRAWFDSACDIAHVDARVMLESGSPHTLVALARSGYGVAIVPSTTPIPHRDVRGVPLVLRGSPIGRWSVVAWCPTAEIWKDNVLASPYFKEKNGKLKTFDFVVANPPFSFKAWSNGFNPFEDEFHRFDFGVPPPKNGDLAFLLHILSCVKSTGKAAVNLPHGVLFRGGAEAAIRREIVKRGYIKGIIGLPPNLFYGTGIPACIVVLDKENAHARKGIFMVDASKGFIKDGNKNRLRAQDRERVLHRWYRTHLRRTIPPLLSKWEIRCMKNLIIVALGKLKKSPKNVRKSRTPRPRSGRWPPASAPSACCNIPWSSQRPGRAASRPAFICSTQARAAASRNCLA
jgi:N-6 DNA Methylase/LysR substrate binding domain